MKKKMIVLCALMAFALVTGCTKQEETKEEVQNQEDIVVEEETVVMPLPATIDVNNMSDCIAAISLSDKAAFFIEEGKVQMKVKVWTYDLYDMVDISMLEEGSLIQIREETVEVSSLEVVDNGVLINGGLDNGGYELRTNEDNVYYEIGYSDKLAYYELGEAVLTVAEDFTFIDSSDLDKGEMTYTIEDLQNNEDIYFNFNPDNTKIVIEKDKIVVMERVYTP